MSTLDQIRPQKANFHTSQGVDWLDGLPLIALPAAGGAIPGATNVGKGSLVVASVDAGADPAGVQVVAVTAIANGQTYLSVTDADGAVTGRGVVGLPIYAGGVTFTLSPVAGQTALAVGDTFAIATIPAPLDLTGFVFSLDARQSTGAATIALQATSDPLSSAVNRIANGGPSGALAMAVPRATMKACPPGVYPHNIIATEVATGRRVVAFYGRITHQAVLQPNA